MRGYNGLWDIMFIDTFLISFGLVSSIINLLFNKIGVYDIEFVIVFSFLIINDYYQKFCMKEE